MTQKWVYSFGCDQTDGDQRLRNLLGGKGANLAEMSNLGLPVPPGLTITTEVCHYYYTSQKTYPEQLKDQVGQALKQIEQKVGLVFGDEKKPLLVSVRSGARVSMPGMMDTILNLGLNDQTVEALAHLSGDARFAWDSYRRFIQMYGDVVLNVAHDDFEKILEEYKHDHHLKDDTDISAEGLKHIVADFKDLVLQETKKEFPQDVQDQLWSAIGAVFKSWMTPRAVTYRKINSIPEEWGTAVTVQAMVFGNRGSDCATGVAFTRDPSTGENYFYGEFLVNAQGEDVVAGIRTPQPLSRQAQQKDEATKSLPCMEDVMPDVYRQLNEVRLKLETHYKDMQDIEFTVQSGQLYMLQTRSGKRTAQAALKIAVDMVHEKLITKEEALLRLDASSLDQLLHPTLDPKAKREIFSTGLPASPGAASGRVVFDADRAEHQAKDGQDVILVRIETSPEDIHGMHAARGIVTSRGGMTSHAAVVARGMGRACVAGAGSIHIDLQARKMICQGVEISEGDYITIDGAKGEVMLGKVPTILPNLSPEFETIMTWADHTRRLNVRANAETPEDAKMARQFGAEGIGLCRTEHMFFDPKRIQKVREMIVADTEEMRHKALEALLPEQRQDFVDLFQIMQGLPVTIRLLDPPLHEFLPHSEKEIDEFALQAKMPVAVVTRRLAELEEANPMLGHRGCRLGLTYPDIYKMQVKAILQAAQELKKSKGLSVVPEIMIPLVVGRPELARLKNTISECAKDYSDIQYMIGTMIELPRAALMAHDIAHEAEFFSFGTNDLTQTTLGMSRDDAGAFLPFYVAKNLLPKDPFVSIDVEGVGQLVSLACERGRQTKPNLKLGICGEHGGDPASIAFFDSVGLDYVSCSAFRVPIARLAAAQARLKSLTLAPETKKAA
jgi:pyruvate, orthophosphate dikinase